MDDVVAPTMPKQVAKHTEAKYERRPDPPTTTRIKLQPRPHRDDADAIEVRGLVRSPLRKGQVADIVTRLDKASRKVPVPPLRPADGVRIETVVDDADPHRRQGSRESLRAAAGLQPSYLSAASALLSF
jgi:hypothetical protein